MSKVTPNKYFSFGSFTPPECCGKFLPIQRKRPRAIQGYRDSSPKSFLMIGASFSRRRKHRLADYKSSLARLQRCRKSVNVLFFFCFCSIIHVSDRYILIFHMAVSRFKAFCLRALQTFAVSDHIRRLEVWSYCSPPPVCHCENVPLSRLLEVILGNSFQCRK